eukprot:PhM_4_TR17012/c0_g1_i1/m.96668
MSAYPPIDPKKALVVGATGATGRHLVRFLLDAGCHVTIIVRDPTKLPTIITSSESYSSASCTIIQGSLLGFSDAALRSYVAGCGIVASCLGHNMTLKGMCGHPRKLCTDATRRLCYAMIDVAPATSSSATPSARFVLMNTSGNKIFPEVVSRAHAAAVCLLRCLVPPHVDNERATDVLVNDSKIVAAVAAGSIEWVVVRPDGLIDEPNASEYVVHASPTRDCLFNSGKTSRVNVAHFMAALAMDSSSLWLAWKGRMPVIYNKGYD